MVRILTLCVALLLALVNKPIAQPVLDYVNKPDTSFQWKLVSQQTAPTGMRTAELEMVSQTWQGIQWRHRILLCRPPEAKSTDTFLLFITGDYNPSEAAMLTNVVSSALKAPIAVLFDIPNQPLYDGRREDALIAYTFVKYLETGDKTWPLLFPMTKAAVRAMDAVQQFAKSAWNLNVSGFVVTGASKRGWTTWFTGAVDNRVKGIAPMVYNNLNLPEQMRLQVQSFGTYSEQISDYTVLNLPQMLNTKEGAALAAIVDPYTLRSRIKMPKLLINGTNDRYWPLDAASKYFPQLVGPKYLLYAPNSGHGLEDRQRVLEALSAFYWSCAAGEPFPTLNWRFEPYGKGQVRLVVRSNPAPADVSVWVASSPSRDFREAKWERRAATRKGDAFTYLIDIPKTGYTAAFGEASYSWSGGSFRLSTDVRIFSGASAPKAGKPTGKRESLP
jgi:PhoPQ-activated pathogenicity-related protein